MKTKISFMTLTILILTTLSLAEKIKPLKKPQKNTVSVENKTSGSPEVTTGNFQYGTPFQAKELVTKAAFFMKHHDLNEAFSAFRDKSSDYFVKDLYIFVFDMDGNMLCHGKDEDLIGRNLIDLKDSKGKLFVKDFINIMERKKSGWVEYYWRNYETQEIEQKLTYLKKITNNIFIGCGAYYTKR